MSSPDSPERELLEKAESQLGWEVPEMFLGPLRRLGLLDHTGTNNTGGANCSRTHNCCTMKHAPTGKGDSAEIEDWCATHKLTSDAIDTYCTGFG